MVCAGRERLSEGTNPAAEGYGLSTAEDCGEEERRCQTLGVLPLCPALGLSNDGTPLTRFPLHVMPTVTVRQVHVVKQRREAGVLFVIFYCGWYRRVHPSWVWLLIFKRI
jgi:hypothetical protein